MTSRRPAGPEGPRDPRSPGRSSGSSEDNGFGDRPQVVGVLPRQQTLEPRLTGSLQNLPQESQLVVPPPVPPRTPQVRQPRGRARAPQPPIGPRPLPPLPARPATQPTPAPQQQKQQQQFEEQDNVFVEHVAQQPPDTVAVSVEVPSQPADSRRHSDDDDEEPAPMLFAKCTRSASRSKSRDDDEIIAENISNDAPGPALEHDASPGTSRQSAGRNQPTGGARLRPPLAGTAGVSADSGTGDSGSAEIQVDGIGTPQTHQPPDDELADEPHEAEGGDGAADDELADDLDELQELRFRHLGGEATTPSSKYAASGRPLPKHQVKPFTKASLDRLENRHVQLVRDYGFQPKRKKSVEDGGVLPHKFEPFPSKLYGRPLEEIDNFIYDEVSVYVCLCVCVCVCVFAYECDVLHSVGWMSTGGLARGTINLNAEVGICTCGRVSQAK